MRQAGYYWIKYSGEWLPAYYDPYTKNWFHYKVQGLYDWDLQEIDESEIKRKS